jgi:hypothetical protein
MNRYRNDERIARAKSVRVEDEIDRRGVHLKRQGRELIGPCPACGGIDRFGVNVAKNIWHCRVCSRGGDVIDLVQHLDNCTFPEAVATLTGDATGRATDPERERLLAQQHEQHQREREAEGREHERRRREIAAWLWSRSKPITAMTPPWAYLRGKRGYTGLIPATLGYLPRNDAYPPSMIAAFGMCEEIETGVIVPPATVTGVHLTRLTPRGDKFVQVNGEKVEIKVMIGSSMGQPIMLAPANDLLALDVTEGIEDGLSIYEARRAGVWVAGAAGRMPALAGIIPSYVECVNIFAHRDDAGIRHARELAQLLSDKNIEARSASTPCSRWMSLGSFAMISRRSL